MQHRQNAYCCKKKLHALHACESVEAFENVILCLASDIGLSFIVHCCLPASALHIEGIIYFTRIEENSFTSKIMR